MIPRTSIAMQRAPAQGRRRIRLLVAVEASLEREALLALLRPRPHLRVIGSAGTPVATLTRCAELAPDVLLLDTRLAGPPAMPLIGLLRAAVPRTRILAFAPHAADRCVLLAPAGGVAPGADGSDALPCESCLQAALAAGAHGAMTRDVGATSLCAAIRALAAGGAWRPAVSPPSATPHPLSPQEMRVARLVGDGASNKEIASTLGISERTAKKHIGHALRKLGLHDRLQLGLCVARHPLAFGSD